MVTPDLEHLKDSQELLVVCIVITFGSTEGSRVEGYGVNLTIRQDDGVDCGDRILRCVRFDYLGDVRFPMGEDGGRGEGKFEIVEGLPTIIIKGPWFVLVKETCEWDNNV